ncbi:MAG: sigma-54-dependent Fis family transcriptional regulator [Deltaproteobacteria bacterium]|nr:sigma-54-dependent Fis family transcriptional regulator [Nannocystaceae bacterium]
MAAVLLVEDDAGLRATLRRLLASLGHEADERRDVASGIAALAEREYDLLLLDLGLPDGDGQEILAHARGPRAPVAVVMSGRDDMQSTVDAVANGAYEFLVKPLDLDGVGRVVARAVAEREIRRRLDVPVPREVTDDGLLVGRSPSMRTLFHEIGRVAPTRATVLVLGESGTGKELVARALHASGPTRDAPFVAMSCAAVSSGLLESELFGHARGAFTSAVSDRPGRLEVAGEGTLLLDEVAELAPEIQAKLLRMLEQRTFERVGESTPRPVRARIIAATHHDLRREVEAGRFREDLYHRLRVVVLEVPPLRDRLEDLDALVDRLLHRAARELDKPAPSVAPAAMARLRAHSWPGNVRELFNMLQRAVVLAPGSLIGPELLQLEPQMAAASPVDAARTLAQVERDHIAQMLETNGWHKKRSAEQLGISRPTLDRKIRAYGLAREDDP